MRTVPILPGSSAPLVGRSAELAEIKAALGVGGRPTQHAVLLAGDAGVGKTRLLTTLRDACFEQGWQVVAGHCLDFGDSELSYLPFSEVIGRLVADHADLVETVSAEHPALARLRPGRRLLGEPDAEDAREHDATDSLDRGALYAGVHALVEAAALDQPLLLVIEDTHWADSSTRDLLSFLLSRSFEAHVSLVVSYRSDDLHRRHPLRRQAAGWARIPGVARMQLEPLGAGDVRTLVKRLDEGALTGPEVERIVAGAEGNAFFVEELVAAAGREGHLPTTLPDDLVDLLLVRLDVLSPAGEEVVRAAAVAGRRVSHALLDAAAGLPRDVLDQGLRDAVEHHVLVPDRQDSYAFRHALLAEAVHDDLLPGERTRLHAAYADAMREGRAPGTAAELARHARRAHDPATALAASIRAGDEAMSVAGPQEAAAHYEAALDLLDDPGLPADPPPDVAALGQRAVEALIASGSPPRALALAERLLGALPDGADPEQRTQLRVAVASAVLVAETRRDAHDFTAPALAELPQTPTALRARLLHLHARALHFRGEVDQAREVASEALRVAESLDLPRLASDVLGTLAGFDREDGAPEDVERALRAATEAAVGTGARAAELRSRWLTGRWHYDRAELPEAAEAFAGAYAHARRIGSQWAPYGFDARFALFQLAYLTGDWDHATAVGTLDEVDGPTPPSIPAAILTSGLLAVHAGRGEVGALFDVPALRARWDDDGIIAVTGAPAAIELYAYAGEPATALAHHDDAVAELGRMWRRRFHGRVRLAAVTIAGLSLDVTERSTEQRARTAADVTRVHDEAATVLRDLREVGAGWGPEGVAWASRLGAERLRFAWLADVDPPAPEALVAAWRADLAAFEAMHHVFESARSAARLATVLRATGETAESRVLADQARETAQRLGAVPLLEELRSLGRTPVPRATPGPRESLTPREREILALVAAGRSNGEIGRQLFIATKTVSVHVSNILAKLGASGRTEAAAIARRDRLL